MKPSEPALRSKPPYSAPSPVRIVQSSRIISRSCAIFGGDGSDSSLTQAMLGISVTSRASSGTDMETWVEAGWSWRTRGMEMPSATLEKYSTI